MEDTQDQQQAIIKRLKNVLRGQAMVVREDTFLNVEDRNTQLQVILNLAEFLEDYDKNLNIWKGEPKPDKQIEQEDIDYR